jgi:predicted permease
VPGRDRVVVLSDALWRRQFGADAAVLGRELRLDGESYRVIGVLPRGVNFPESEAGLFVPFAFTPEQAGEDQRGVNYSSIVARLAPGATRAQAEAQAAGVVRSGLERLAGQGEEAAAFVRERRESGFRFGTRPLRERLRGDNAGELGLLQAAVGLVLLIALANAGNLALVRWSARQGELAVRNALGARARDVARQLLAEAGVLAAAGGLLGGAIAWAGVALVAHSGLLPGWVQFGFDLRSAAFALAVSALAALAFGAAPVALALRAGAASALHASARVAGAGRATRHLRAALVVAQVALAIALLAGTGLLWRSFARAAAQSPGFDSAQILSARLSLPAASYPDAAAQSRGLERMLEAVRALPGVEAAGLTTKLPFGGANGGLFFRLVGDNPAQQPHANLRSVDDAYFSTLRIPLLRGRLLDARDRAAGARSLVIDANFAQRYFAGGEAVGRQITLGQGSGGEAWTIVGVVGAVKHFDLTLPSQKPTFYFPLGAFATDDVFLVLRLREPNAAAVDAMRRAVRSVDAQQPLFDVRSLDERIAGSLVGRRVPLQLLGLFALGALALAAVGLYGVLAFGVAQRTREIGLRMAIGADARRVRRQVLGDGLALVGPGLALGALAAVAIGFALRSRLFQVAPVDPPTLAGVAAVIALTAFAACWLPARRAARLDPLVALRHE